MFYIQSIQVHTYTSLIYNTYTYTSLIYNTCTYTHVIQYTHVHTCVHLSRTIHTRTHLLYTIHTRTHTCTPLTYNTYTHISHTIQNDTPLVHFHSTCPKKTLHKLLRILIRLIRCRIPKIRIRSQRLGKYRTWTRGTRTGRFGHSGVVAASPNSAGMYRIMSRLGSCHG